MAKAAGQPKSPLLRPPRQRPTLQRRNVLDQLPDEYQSGIERKLTAAYAMTGEADARRALDQIPSRTGKDQSQRRAQLGRRNGRNSHRTQIANAGDAAEIVVIDQHHRIRILGGRRTLPAREALEGG